MAHLNWTNQSIDDLVNIADFIAKDSKRYAKITINKIKLAARKVKDFPLIGRIVPELSSPELREIIIGNYRLIYFVVDKDRIDVLSVFHTSRLLNLEEIKKQTR
jgi:toxin ParE1/3/4